MKRLLISLHRCVATFARAPRIAIVGSGPAGLYVCASVLRRLSKCKVDVVECSAVPYGLIRYGVAPDHPEVKNCINKFDRMFTANAQRLSLFCNVCVGRDISFDELCADYDAIVLAYGAKRQRRLSIPGINSKNVFSGGDFVSWYNAFPGARQPKLDCENAVVVGVGNVALDCCRILLSAGGERLAQSDMPSEVFDHLAKSNVNTVTIVGRRGPLDVSFTIKELREQITLPGCSFAIQLSDFDLTDINEALNSLPRPKKRLIELMMKNWNRDKPRSSRHCELLFRRSPVEVVADDAGWVRGVRLRNSQTGSIEDLPCGLLICCLGYENVVLGGVPKNKDGQIKMRDSIRVHTNGETSVYACGWCAHTPRGVIATTQADSMDVAAALCSDMELKGVKPNIESCISERLKLKGIQYTSWEQWKAIDEREKRLGEEHGKQREKVERMTEDVAVRQPDCEIDPDIDTDNLVLSQLDILKDNERYDSQQKQTVYYPQRVASPSRSEVTENEEFSSGPFDSDLAIGAEACTTPATGRPLSARKLQFDTTLSPSTPVAPKRSCLKSLDVISAKAVTFNSEMGRHRNADIGSVSSSEVDDDDSKIAQPFLHKYVDALNEIFAKAQNRIDDLNLMCIASAELDKFAVDMEKSGKSAQFAIIENLSAEEARHLLRAEMLRNEQSDVRIEMLTKRNTQLEKRLAVTDTAEKHYSLMKLDMEKKLKKLLEEFGEVERKRIERCTQLIERNAKLEKRHTLSVAQNETLNAQVVDLNGKIINLKQELQKLERDNKGLRCQVDSLKESFDRLRERFAQLEKELMVSGQRRRELEDRLKEEGMNVEREKENVRRLEEDIRRERELAEERLKTTEQKLARAHDVELDRKREEYESDLNAISRAYEKNMMKAKEEIGRVKRERDELVMKVCDFEHNHELYKRQVFVDAQQKLANSCQKAVTEFSGGTTSDRENISPHYASAIPSTVPSSAALMVPTVTVPLLNLGTKSTSVSAPLTHRSTTTNTTNARRKTLLKGRTAPDMPSRRAQSVRKT